MAITRRPKSDYTVDFAKDIPIDRPLQIGDRVVGRWLANDGSRPVQGWSGIVRNILPKGSAVVAFPPYGKNELTRICSPDELRFQP